MHSRPYIVYIRNLFKFAFIAPIMISKKGEAVPLLILAIGILLAIYSYFLPVDEKCSLMPGLVDCKVSEAEVYVNETPGMLEQQETAVRYLMPEARLFRMDSVDIASVLENAKASRGWFFSKPAEADFEAQENAKAAKFFVFVNKAEGDLKVYLNNKKVGVISGKGMQQVILDPKDLREENTIKVVPTAPLFPFLSNNYEIGKVILKEEYTITNNRVSMPFSLAADPEDILDITFSFRTRCFTEDNLSVYIGSKKLIEDKVCRGFSKDVTDIAIQNMAGNVTFASEGNYIIREAMFNIRMKEKTWPTYYFYLEDLDKPITLKMGFNETGTKKLTAYVNGNALSVETSKKEWKTVINKYLLENETNSIMLLPVETVVVSKLEVM